MKITYFSSIIAWCFVLSVKAQRPFQELGLDHEVDYITLSDGRYVEYFDNDTLRQIGSVMFNTQTNKVAYIIPEDELDKIKIAKRERTVSRFMSVDPLSDKYPFYTPYAFSGNRVIDCRELEGLEPIDAVGSNGQPLFKEKAILTLPDASQVTIWNAQQGGRFIISREDMQRINSFKDQGYSARPQIQAPQTTGIVSGTTQVQGMTYIDGATLPSDYPNNQFMSTTIQAPSQLTINPLQPVQQNFQGQYKRSGGLTGSVIPIGQLSIEDIQNHAAMTANNANTAITNLTSAAPQGAVVNNFAVSVPLNQNMTSEQAEAFKTTFMDNINPNATVNFGSFNPSDSTAPGLAVGASSASQFNQVTATQTGPAVTIQTYQEISQP